jgi:hypothetical protein
MKSTMSEASWCEQLIKLPTVSPDSCPVCEEDLVRLADLGSAQAIAILSGCSIANETTIKNDYSGGFGNGIRTYTSKTKVKIPTSLGKSFLLTFDTRMSLYFRDREARTSYKNWLFNGIPFPFEKRLGDEASVWELFYSVGSSLPLLEARISPENEEGIRHARRRWLESFK